MLHSFFDTSHVHACARSYLDIDMPRIIYHFYVNGQQQQQPPPQRCNAPSRQPQMWLAQSTRRRQRGSRRSHDLEYRLQDEDSSTDGESSGSSDNS